MLEKIKRKIKQFLQSRGLKLHMLRVERLVWKNVFQTNFKKNVLVVHFPYVFEEGIKKTHTNYQECYSICEVFQELGFNVDVISYNAVFNEADLDLSRYQVCFGQGPAFEYLFDFPSAKKIPKIHYATGLNQYKMLGNTLNAIIDFKSKYGFLPIASTLLKSIYTNHQSLLSSAIYVWGNQYTKSTFTPYFGEEKVKLLTAFFYKVFNIDWSKKDFSNKNNYLWIGSRGAINRGLHIAIEFFKENPHLNLHIAGSYLEEKEFAEFFQSYDLKNVHFYGFLPIKSEAFERLLYLCNFQLYLSCGDGTSASVLTGVGNGGLIPIITKECSVDVSDFGFSTAATLTDLTHTFELVSRLTKEQVEKMSRKAYETINRVYTVTNFKQSLKSHIIEDIGA